MYGRDNPGSFRATLAAAFGATYINPQSVQDARPAGFDLILECTGSDEVLLEAAQWLNPRGAMCWLGASRNARTKPLNLMRSMQQAILGNHLHFGSVNAAPRDFESALHNLVTMNRTHAEQLRALITCRVSLEEALWHYTHREPQGVKTVLSPG